MEEGFPLRPQGPHLRLGRFLPRLLGLDLGLDLLLLGQGRAVSLELLLLAGQIRQALPEIRGRRRILAPGLQLRNGLIDKVLREKFLLEAPYVQRGEEGQIKLLVGLVSPQVLEEPADLRSDLGSIREHVEIQRLQDFHQSAVERAGQVKEAGHGGAVQDPDLLHLPVEHRSFIHLV